MSATTLDSKLNVLVVGTDDICGYFIAKTMMNQVGKNIRVGHMFKDCPLTKKLKEKGAEVMKFDLSDHKSIEKMFEGMHCVIIVPPVYGEDYNKAKCIIDVAARCKDMKRAVMISLLNANKLSDWDRLKQIHEMEKEFENKMNKCEKAYILRKSVPLEGFYMLRRMIQEKNQFPWAFGDNEIAPISLCDVGHAAICLLCDKHEKSEILSSEKLENLTLGRKIYCLTGPSKMDGREIAKRCSNALGTEIQLKKMKVSEIIEIIRKEGYIHEQGLKFLEQCMEATNKGCFSEKTRDLEDIIGKKPMSVDKYFEENRNDFAPKK